MTLDIQAIKARRAAIMPGEWQASRLLGVNFGVFDALNGCVCVVDSRYPLDGETYATFIAAAPADIDALLAEVERLTAALDAVPVTAIKNLFYTDGLEGSREVWAWFYELEHPGALQGNQTMYDALPPLEA